MFSYDFDKFSSGQSDPSFKHLLKGILQKLRNFDSRFN